MHDIIHNGMSLAKKNKVDHGKGQNSWTQSSKDFFLQGDIKQRAACMGLSWTDS